jgi:hypothetical protein
MKRNLVLYRGDSSVIEDFRRSKTKKYSLLGQGIYLTDSEKIAKTYREKGAVRNKHQVGKIYLYQGLAQNRLRAFELAFLNFVNRQIEFSGISCYSKEGLRLKDDKKFLAKTKAEYMRLIEEGTISADYAYKNTTTDARIDVIYDDGSIFGEISKFVFDENEFNSSVLKIDTTITDSFFWELMWDHKVGFGVPKETKEEFIYFNSTTHFNIDTISKGAICSTGLRLPKGDEKPQTKIYDTSRDKVFNRMRVVLTPYGYKGLEYSGGYLIGGFGRHRAFCIWDDFWVNYHRI